MGVAYNLDPLKMLTDDERRGAIIALNHVMKRGQAMQRVASKNGPGAFSVQQRMLLRQAGGLVVSIARGTRQDLRGDVERWHVDPR